jgi:CRISPR-associated endoribonuclease Cas6
MIRVHFQLPAARPYATQDLIHDALVAGLVQTGLSPEQLIGPRALPFTFACHGRRGHYDAKADRRIDWLDGLTVSTADPVLAQSLGDLTAEHILTARALSMEMISLVGATKQTIPCPIATGQTCVGAYWLSPLVHTQRNAKDRKRYLTHPLDVEKVNPGELLSKRLGQPITLSWMADRLAVRSATRQQTDTPLKVTPGAAPAMIYVPGTLSPFVLSGTSEALTTAWYAGLGSKTRMGFGCWDTQPQTRPAHTREGH